MIQGLDEGGGQVEGDGDRGKIDSLLVRHRSSEKRMVVRLLCLPTVAVQGVPKVTLDDNWRTLRES